MRLCSNCSRTLTEEEMKCPVCGGEPTELNVPEEIEKRAQGLTDGKKLSGSLLGVLIAVGILLLLCIIGLVGSSGNDSDEQEMTTTTTVEQETTITESTTSTTITTTATTTTATTTTTTTTTTVPTTTVPPTTTTTVPPTTTTVMTTTEEEYQGERVYVTPTGECYHYSSDCAGKNARATTLDDAWRYRPCKKCAQ